MPHLRFETNVPKDKIPKEFPRELNRVLAQTLGKPEEVSSLLLHTIFIVLKNLTSYLKYAFHFPKVCVVTVVPDQIMVHGTGEGPCAQATVMSIGKLGETENIRHSKALADKVAEIGVPSTRFYITFYDTLSFNVGVAGTTAKVKEG